MKSKYSDLVWLLVSIFGYLVMSISFTIMPLIDQQASPFIDKLPGLMFWSFLLIGAVSQIVLAVRRNKWLNANGIEGPSSAKCRIGLLSFMRNLPACLADGLFVLSLIALIIAVIMTDGMGYLCYVFLAFTVFSFCMHCVFNGKVYYFLTHRDMILKTSQKKHFDKSEKE